MASLEEDFPRGGTSKKTPGSKSTVEHIELDNLFQTCEPEVKKKRKSTRSDAKDVKKRKTSKEESLKLNAASAVNVLSFKSIKVGTLFLGCVKEVTDFQVTVSLPNGLKGFLPVGNISASYTRMLSNQLETGDSLEGVLSLPSLFRPGKLLRCIVSALESTQKGHTSIRLSINPKEVNKGFTTESLKPGMILSGCVESIEDHGFLVDIGVSGTRAFLPKAKNEKISMKQGELKVGQYVDCFVKDIKNDGRVVLLSISPSAITQSCAETHHGWTLRNLPPGLLVKAQVRKVDKHGLTLEFLSSFTGTVDFLHVDRDRASSYSPGETVKACVLFIEPSTRHVGLSLREHLLKPVPALEPTTSELISEVFQDCRMIFTHRSSGAILELPEKMVAFVNKHHMKDMDEPLTHNQIKSKPSHVCRILDFSPLEQMPVATLRRSIIDTTFLRYQDLQPGQVVEGSVSSLQTFGMIVEVTDYIRGMVPRTHLADIVLKKPEKLYRVGSKVKCRVMSVDPVSRKLLLTRKKALLTSTLPLICSYADIKIGQVSHGWIVSVLDLGCIVRFFGNVKGLVPSGELSKEPVSAPRKLFYIGQVVKAKVLSCDPTQERLLLSFKAVVDKQSDTARKPKLGFETGKEVEVKVVRKLLEGFEVSILPEEAPAFLPTTHLSDHLSNCCMFWGALKEGDLISDVVCLGTNKSGPMLTRKPLLKAAIADGLVAKEFSEIQVGMQLVGWIKGIMPYGVFVEFPYGLVGLAPKSAMNDKFITNTEDVFQKGQTVAAKVTDIDEEKRRFLVCLKVSAVCFEEGDSWRRLVHGLQERKAVAEMVATKGSPLLQFLSTLTAGQKLKLTVKEVNDDGSATFSGDELSGASIVAAPYHVTGVTLTPGQRVTAVVLHVDPCETRITVSVAPQLLGKRRNIMAGAVLSATVQYVDRDFAVISLGDSSQLTTVHTAVHLNDTFHFESETMAVGKILCVTVKEPSCEDLGGLPLVSWTYISPDTLDREKKVGPRSQVARKHTYKMGDVVTGTVKSVKPLCVFVSLPGGVRGSIHISHIPEDIKKSSSFLTASLKKGQKVTAKVIGEKESPDHKFLPITHPELKLTELELTLLPRLLKDGADIKTTKKLKSYQAGDDVTCFVLKYNVQKKQLKVIVTPSINGTVDLLAMTVDRQAAKYPERMFKMGQALPAKVVGLDSSRKKLSLSLTGVYELSPGAITLGIVQELLADSGLLVSLPFNQSGYVSVLDLSDSYRPNPLDGYWIGKIVRCCVVGEEHGRLQLSLRSSRTEPESTLPVKDPEVLSIGDLKKGQLVRGYVKRLGTNVVFIWLSRTITGLARFEHVTSYHVTDKDLYAKHIPLLALYTTKVLRVSKGGQVELSLLPEDTGKPDVLPESLALPLREKGQEKKANKDPKKRKRLVEDLLKNQKTGKGEKAMNTEEEDDSGVEAYFPEEEPPPKTPKKMSQQVKVGPEGPERLQVAAGFSWDLTLGGLLPAVAQKGADSSDEEDGEAQLQKKSRKDRDLEKQQAEKELCKLENELMDSSARPESASSFERLVLSSPNSSLVWLQYMAFHLQATEIEQARAVAERALKTISFREEQEKLNVWVALLNLENLYGSEESLQKVFERALQYCEPLVVYQQLADIYAKSNKHKESEALYKNMVKRFRQARAVWLSYGTFLLRQGQNDAAHALLQRALRSLPDKEHVDLIAKFAQLEFQYGDVERAKSMFDRTLTSYPKRTDLWSVYIDLMIKHGTQKEVRDLFDCVIHLSVAVKRIKFFFKRYLEYEKKNGTAESVQAVKEKALQYVEAKGSEVAS